MSFFSELKRRNVLRVALAYLALAWLLIQVAAVIVPAYGLPQIVVPAVVTLFTLGLPLVLVFSWFYELTPSGLVKESELARDQSTTHRTARKLNFAVIALLVMALAYFVTDKFLWKPNASAAEKSIAVLPFVNMSSDPEQEYFSDGLSEELINVLAKLPDLRVTARTSAFSFKGKSIPIAEIAQVLNVRHVLEGSVRRSGNQLRITAQLIDAGSGYHLWSETYDRTLKDIFAIQEEIAATVAEALQLSLLGDQVPQVAATDPQAYELYLRARHVSGFMSGEGFMEAERLLRQSLEIDADYAPAWALLGYVLAYQKGQGLVANPDQALAGARAAAQQAILLDPRLGEAYAIMGGITFYHDFNFPLARQQFAQAMELDPNNALILDPASALSVALGDWDQALRLALKAVATDPVRSLAHSNLGTVLLWSGQDKKAEASLRTALSLNRENFLAKVYLSAVLLNLGRGAESLQEAVSITEESWRLYSLALAYDAAGQNTDSDAALDQMIEKYADTMAANIAWIYGNRGEHDLALEWLERAYRQRDGGVAFSMISPELNTLHGDPRFDAFLRKVGVSE